jgi:hypothetical protein
MCSHPRARHPLFFYNGLINKLSKIQKSQNRCKTPYFREHAFLEIRDWRLVIRD